MIFVIKSASYRKKSLISDITHTLIAHDYNGKLGITSDASIMTFGKETLVMLAFIDDCHHIVHVTLKKHAFSKIIEFDPVMVCLAHYCVPFYHCIVGCTLL